LYHFSFTVCIEYLNRTVIVHWTFISEANKTNFDHSQRMASSFMLTDKSLDTQDKDKHSIGKNLLTSVIHVAMANSYLFIQENDIDVILK